MAHPVLIIEDEPVLARNIKAYLERHGHEAVAVHSGEEGIDRLDGFRPEVVVLDFHLPRMSGLEVLARIRAGNPHIRVIMITGDATVEVAVQAMKLGACDYLPKPVVLRDLRLLVEHASGRREGKENGADPDPGQDGGGGLSKLLGESAPMLALKDSIRRLAQAERQLLDNDLPTVLIIGETGTGKEVVARAVHVEGARRARPFVEINCASIPPHMLEAELFGHERGAFTDARERKLGLIEAADGGTLFLDEIGELELPMQAKLLKVLEEKKLRRLGGLREHRLDFRVIAATNQDLHQRVREGRFRSDLYYRLKMVQLAVPPLRQRDGDVLLLARAFLSMHASRYRKPGLFFTPCAEQALRAWHWPGNVRELRNMLEQIALMASHDAIAVHELPLPAPCAQGAGANVPGAPAQQALNLEGMERQYLVAALGQSRWNVTQAAKALGLSRDAMRYRIGKYSLKEGA